MMLKSICSQFALFACILCLTAAVESNLVAMGFEVTSDSVVARLPDPPSSVQPSSNNMHSAQVVHLIDPKTSRFYKAYRL